MKSLFKKHYERTKRNSTAVKCQARSLENNKINVVTEGSSHGETGVVTSNGNNISKNDLSRIGSVSMPSESGNSQKDDSSNILKQVAENRNYPYTQLSGVASEYLEVSVESSSNAATGRRRSHSERDDTQSDRCNKYQNILSHTGSLNLLNESMDSEKSGSSNILRHTGNYERDSVEVSESKTFRQAQFKNEVLEHWKTRVDDMELSRSHAPANAVGHQRNHITRSTGGYVTVPKRVRIRNGE
jgi:hypothetical protein